MNISLANSLFDEGIFKELYKAGFISDKIFLYREIYLWVDAQMKNRGVIKATAVLEAEVHFNLDRRTIYRALSCFTPDREDAYGPAICASARPRKS